MSMKLGTLFLATALFGLAGALVAGTRQTTDTNRAATPSEGEQGQLVAKGKAIFVEKCAKCHNERGDKELSSGKPLSERGLDTETIARAVNGRLSKGTEEERRAVTTYIGSLMKDGAKGEAKR